MRTECAWCRRELRPEDGQAPVGAVSHGCCSDCAAKLLADRRSTPGPILEALTIAETGRELRASESTVRRLIDLGKLRAVQVGKTKRVVLRRDLVEFATGRSPTALGECEKPAGIRRRETG